MAYALYSTIDELLAPETLTMLTGHGVQSVRTQPMAGGHSGARLVAVETNDGTTSTRYILKQMARQFDWLMLASDDRCCRSVTLWQWGLLDRLQPEIEHAIIACAHDGAGWAMLMRDVSAVLTDGQPFTGAQVFCLLDALAALHATYWEASELADPQLGLCDSMGVVRVFSPETGCRFPGTASLLPQFLVEGWALLQEMVAPDVADALGVLFADPQPLCAALARYPATLVHGDYRSTNVGILGQNGPETVLLDWQLAAYTVATVDLAWFLCMSDVQLSPVPAAIASEYYRRRLAKRLGARFDNDVWEPLLALGTLTNVLRNGCFRAWFIAHPVNEAQQFADAKALAECEEQVRTALPWL